MRQFIPQDGRPQFGPGLAALAAYLRERSYDLGTTARIVTRVAVEGTLEGCGVRPEHMAEAEFVYVANLDPIAYDDPAWGDDVGALDAPPVGPRLPRESEIRALGIVRVPRR